MNFITSLWILLIIWKVIKLPYEHIYNYYSQKNCFNLEKIFVDDCEENNCKISNPPNDCILLDGDEIEKCLSGILDKSADRIIIKKNASGNKLDIYVCELSHGKRNPKVIENKIKNTANHIVSVIKPCEFEINEFKCFYIGQYEDLYKGLMKKKSPVIKINGLNINKIRIKRFNCGTSFDRLN